VGILCFYGGELLRFFFPFITMPYDAIIWGAVAVSGTQLLMVLFDLEHSPGAGIAIGLVLESWQVMSLSFIILSVFFLALLHRYLRKYLINLI
jgi:membrane protein implicated in regulation of membrane protease activity